MDKCRECGAPALFIVWGCCDYYNVLMCIDCADLALVEDWGAATPSCDPTTVESLADIAARRANRP